MAEETRRSPWLPVNAPSSAHVPAPMSSPIAPREGVPRATGSTNEDESTYDADQRYEPPATEPSRTPDPVTPRRASVLSPYLENRSAQEPSAAVAEEGWAAGPASAAIPTVGLAPALENPAYGATFVPDTVDPSATSAISEEFAAPRPATPNPGLHGRVPRPVDVDDVEVIRPIEIPPASEILPTSGAMPLLEPPDDEYETMRQGAHTPIGPESDPFHVLGLSAVASASLAAAGAREPAHVEWEGEAAVPNLGESTPFVPMFDVRETGGQPREPETQPHPELDPVAPLTPAETWTPVGGLERVAAAAAASASSPGTDLAPIPHGPGVPTPPESHDYTDTQPWWRKLWVLIVLGVVVLAGLGTLTYRLFFLPEPIILPAPVVTEAPPAPTIEPVELEEPTPLLEAMPSEVSTLVMTSYENIEVLGDKSLPARASEHLVLTYGESTDEDTFTIHVYQFFNTDDAEVAFETWVEGQAVVEDVTVDGTVVGRRAMVPGGAADTLAWSNETVVFVMQGPSDELLEFYSYFGI